MGPSAAAFQPRVLLMVLRPLSSLGPVPAQGSLCQPGRVPKPLARIAGDPVLRAPRGPPPCRARQPGVTGRTPQAISIPAGERGDPLAPAHPPAHFHSEVPQPELAAGASGVLAWLGPARCLSVAVTKFLLEVGPG